MESGAEAEAAEAARRAAKEAEQAEREARKAAQSASVAYETTANRFPMRQKKMFFRQMRQRVTEKMHSNLVRLHSGRRMPFRAECV